MHHDGEQEQNNLDSGNTERERESIKKTRRRCYFSLTLVLIELSLSSSGASERSESRGANHASFTYVLTATTSPITHLCQRREKTR